MQRIIAISTFTNAIMWIWLEQEILHTKQKRRAPYLENGQCTFLHSMPFALYDIFDVR